MASFVFITGGVFTDRDEGTNSQSMESIFKYAIFHYNRLPRGIHNLSFKIRIQEETLSLVAADSTVQTVQDGEIRLFSPSSLSFSLILVCALIHQRRIQGIFGPPYPELATLVHSISNHVDIPFINVCSTCYEVESLDDEAHYESEHHQKRSRMTINLYPSNQDLNVAFHNLTHNLQWTKFLIIFDTDSGRK